MNFTLIEVIALFFIGINIFLLLFALIAIINNYLRYRAKLKINAETAINSDIYNIIIDYIKYAETKGDKEIYLNYIADLPYSIKHKLDCNLFDVRINKLNQIIIKRRE